ncbi:putative beta-1,3-galactosyltransferase 12 [Platanthera guangdongensis]|uniref:Hexosyltransferase n=1 Tax=Platanthera guangdongensis TaxID=2320717 RepID=A0ABR2LZL9_9ASPA
MAPASGLLPSFASPASFPSSPIYYSKDKKPRSFAAAPIHTFLPRRVFALLVISVLCLVAGLGGIAFTAANLRRTPRTITVFRCGRAQDSLRTHRSKSLVAEGLNARPKILGFVGVQTGFSSADRRGALRSTWFPANPESLMSLEQSTGLAFRFVIGRTKDQKKTADLKKEDGKYHDFMFIDVEEEYARLPYKTLAFFKAAFDLFDAEFYVKADDDIYLRPDRLATLLAKDRSHRRTYIGCMKKGPIITNPKLKWYESSGHLLGNEYFIHAYGPIYALSGEVVASLAEARNDSLRMFDNEDVTIGSWMLAMNINHEDNRALCDPKCTPSSIAVWDMPRCSGLCNPVNHMKELHNVSMCSQSPTLPPEDDM